MRYLNLSEILHLHKTIIETSGGFHGIRNMAGLESAIALPRQAFGDSDLYPTVTDKAAILCFAIVRNHPFIDGNKRTAHAAMETFLVLNGKEITADVNEQERIILNLAAGKTDQDEFVQWLKNSILSINMRKCISERKITGYGKD